MATIPCAMRGAIGSAVSADPSVAPGKSDMRHARTVIHMPRMSLVARTVAVFARCAAGPRIHARRGRNTRRHARTAISTPRTHRAVPMVVVCAHYAIRLKVRSRLASKCVYGERFSAAVPTTAGYGSVAPMEAATASLVVVGAARKPMFIALPGNSNVDRSRKTWRSIIFARREVASTSATWSW